jgi:hypothetical protein
VRALVVLFVIMAVSPAAADTSVNLGMGVGGMIGHGSLAERIDAVQNVGIDAVIEHGDFAASAGLVILRGDGGANDEIDAFGWGANLKVHFAASDVGRSFVGLGFTEVGLGDTQMPYARRGHAYGPKVALGTEYMANLNRRTMGVALAATYQYLTATFDAGERRHGGYAGIELTLLMGYGKCRDRAGTTCLR